ncbi:MAG: penicillin-binding transpeptidase domain-containing protein, partial [Chloroflexota bacterium]|nr:penicillin-binding transpeptidase domain-containing protein [Chloroflexota bacterium]
VQTIKEKPYRPGNNIYLNIDLELQRQAEQDLASVKLRKGPVAGSVVALDPGNGQILALASLPTFDPNKFVVGFPADEYARLTSKAGKNPFQNRATGSSFPPASTFKPITVAAALTAKLPRLDRTWYSTGTWNRLGKPVRRDWKEGGHGYVKLIDGITESVDTIFYDLGFELYLRDQNYLTEHAKKWHLGRSFDVDGLVDEASGQVPGPGVPYPYWAHGDNVNLAIGQGSMRASPLQMASVYATIGNGGTIYKPLLIDRIVSAENSNTIIKQYKPAVLSKAPVDQRTMEFLQQGLRTVTNAEKGTATHVFQDSAISVAGKTGTGQQDLKDPFAWFVGYSPATSPKIVVAVEAEDAGEGSEIAAPVARKVLEGYLKPPAARP